MAAIESMEISSDGKTVTLDAEQTEAILGRPGEQLSFVVGGRRPDMSIIRIGGGIVASQDLRKEQEIHVVVSTMDGEVVANGYGYVVGVSFKDNYKDGQVDSTDRVQSVKVS